MGKSTPQDSQEKEGTSHRKEWKKRISREIQECLLQHPLPFISTTLQYMSLERRREDLTFPERAGTAEEESLAVKSTNREGIFWWPSSTLRQLAEKLVKDF